MKTTDRTITVVDQPISNVIIAVTVLSLAFSAFLSGCKGSQTIWASEKRSPNGQMIASAHALANGGFGISGVPNTFVELNFSRGSQSPKEVLILDDDSDEPSKASVEMDWTAANHLELRYNAKEQHIVFQAIRYGGVDISLKDVSQESLK